MVLKIALYLALCLAGSAKTAVLPVEKCHLEDSKCMIPAIQKALPVFLDGLPDLGINVMDVLEMDDIKFDISGLQFSLTEGKLKGLKSSIIDDVKWDLKSKKFEIHYHADCTVKGHYTAAGRILVLPITGDGDMKLKLKNLNIKLYISYEVEKGADGKDHIAPKKLDYDFEVVDNAQFSLTNLFNGNKELSDTMLKFLNENWKQISLEFGKPLMDVAAKSIFKNVITFFAKEAIEDIAEV
ncbi:hypothetical protein O3G_MSEX005144 [Manduca sexta]|uniref:Uncharacterized protein n=1 Tax=Manduca sexta TaxID=7130 RepID=A0A921YXF8_MANSE|nr:hypothetical protein O3G_MSEX005144 [Manduca sexta]KAG6447737.1 hypothetical protein O3G_MSEX005144 [Manduca sexta]